MTVRVISFMVNNEHSLQFHTSAMSPYGRPRSICVKDIQMDLRETGYENGRWIKLVQGHVHWWGGGGVCCWQW